MNPNWESCDRCKRLHEDHTHRGLSWDQIIDYGVHLALDHTVVVDDQVQLLPLESQVNAEGG